MPKQYYNPERLCVLDHITVWHTYNEGCSMESDRKNSYHYTLDAEQADPGMGTDSWFDIRDLPAFKLEKDRFEHWERGDHIRIILLQLLDQPSLIPQATDWLEN